MYKIINEVKNPRLVIWMKKKGITETPHQFGDYFAFINDALQTYYKELGIKHIQDQEHFTSYLMNHPWK